MDKYLEYLKKSGAELAIPIDTKSVVTAPWTVFKCQYGCDFYGKKHCCPPSSPTWKQTQEILDCYTRGILFRCPEMTMVSSLAIETARELFLDDYYKAIAFGSGPCMICKECAPGHCTFPKKMIPSMEGCGIDVFATAKNNGIELHTLREKGETANYFGLLLVE